MAIDHYLHLATEMPAPHLAEIVHALAQDADLLSPEIPDSSPARLLGGFGGLRGGSSLSVREESAYVSSYLDQLRVGATASVGFRLNMHEDPVVQEDEMVWLALAVLSRVPGDAIFHYDFETIWLLRRDGVLFVNDNDEYWTPTRLAMLPAHQRAHLAFP